MVKGETTRHLIDLLTPVIFDERLFARKVEQRAGTDIVASSASNFYEGVTQPEVEKFYKGKIDQDDPQPGFYGFKFKSCNEKRESYRRGIQIRGIVR